jgi:hypothetical protein
LTESAAFFHGFFPQIDVSSSALFISNNVYI